MTAIRPRTGMLRARTALINTPGLAVKQVRLVHCHHRAIFVNADDKFGSIQKGRAADLVLRDANPLEDIANTRRIAAVVLKGRFLSAPELRGLPAG